MQTDKSIFDKKALEWSKRHNTPWSKLRYEIALHNILENIPKGQILNILDSGGGDGLDSISLASLGNKVTLIDYSQEMIDLAKAEVKKLKIADHTNLIVDEVENINNHFNDETLDLVMLHNVLSYVKDPRDVIRKNTKVLKKGGLFSLMQVNIYSEVYYPAVFANDLDLALEKLDAKETKAYLFDVKLTRFSAEELIDLVHDQGLKLINRYGIGCLNTFISNNEIKYDEVFYKKLKNLEILMSTKFPYYHVARFNHLIFKKD